MNFKLDMAAVGKFLESLAGEGQMVAATFRDKGHKRFERPLLLSFVLVAGAYYLLYLPPQRKAQGLERRIENAHSLSQVSEAYKDLRGQLREVYSKLPAQKDRDHFLAQAVVESLKAEGLTSDSIRPPEETIESGLAFQRLQISAEIKFTELMAWLARVEASRPFIRVYAVDLLKSKRTGYCQVHVGVATIIPTSDLTH